MESKANNMRRIAYYITCKLRSGTDAEDHPEFAETTNQRNPLRTCAQTRSPHAAPEKGSETRRE